MKKFLLLFSVMFCALASWAEEIEITTDGLTLKYELAADTAIVTGRGTSETATSITFPSSVTYGETTYTVTKIGNSAFYEDEDLVSVTIPGSVKTIESGAFCECSNLTSVTLSEGLLTIESDAFSDCSKLTSITLPQSLTYLDDSFTRTGLESFTIPGNVTHINSDLISESPVESLWVENPDKLFGDEHNRQCFIWQISNNKGIIESQNIDLDIHFNEANMSGATKVALMEQMEKERDTYLANFLDAPIAASITISSLGYATYSFGQDLDFTDSDVKAYIVSAYVPNNGEVILTRINYVPAETGIVVKGEEGSFYVPTGGEVIVLSNMLAANLSATNLNTVSGDNTNYILANGDYGIGFYAIENNTTLAANKAYLPLPTDKLPSSSAGAPARGLRITFNEGDYDGVTGIVDVEDSRTQQGKGVCYNLSGQRVERPAKGIYIVDGKKVFIR